MKNLFDSLKAMKVEKTFVEDEWLQNLNFVSRYTRDVGLVRARNWNTSRKYFAPKVKVNCSITLELYIFV